MTVQICTDGGMWQSVWLRWRMWDSAVGLQPRGSDLMCLWSPPGSVSWWQTPYCFLYRRKKQITPHHPQKMEGTLSIAESWQNTFLSPLLSPYTWSCWPAIIPCQQNHVSEEHSFCFPCGVSMCMHVCAGKCKGPSYSREGCKTLFIGSGVTGPGSIKPFTASAPECKGKRLKSQPLWTKNVLFFF